MEFMNLWAHNLCEDYDEKWADDHDPSDAPRICTCCLNGMKRVTRYTFENKYLLVSIAADRDANGVKIAKAITGHPENEFDLQGKLFYRSSHI